MSMSELKICRVCLRTECRVYKYDRFQLKQYYEEVMALKTNVEDNLPHYFCYECAMVLYKFRQFKEKCYNGQNALKDLIWRGEITYAAVNTISRVANKLDSPIQILKVTKRVKTYCLRSQYETTDSECESFKDLEEKEVSIKDIVRYISDDSMTDHDEYTNPKIDPVGENFKIEIVYAEERHKIEKDNVLIDVVSDAIEPETTKNVFDFKKKDVNLNSEQVNVIQKDIPAMTTRKRRAFKRTKELDTINNWSKSTMTEEEALKEFRKKADDEKYKTAEFKCENCIKWFVKEDILNRHKQLLHSKSRGAYDCRFCHMRFKFGRKLRQHIAVHINRYRCLRCDFVCALVCTAKIHDDFHNGVIKKCDQCGEEFNHATRYYSHLRYVHRSEHVCTMCGECCVSAYALRVHNRAKHTIDDVAVENSKDEEVANTFCERCNLRFKTRNAYEEHLFHSAMHIDDGKKSGIGERKGKKRKPLKIPTTCYQCGKHFETQQACTKHHLKEHPRTSLFPPNQRQVCEICGVGVLPGSMPAHLNSHTRAVVFPCPTCGRVLSTADNRKRHQLTHTGEKPFACTACDKRFTQNGSLKLHYRTFHLKQPYPKRNPRKKKDE